MLQSFNSRLDSVSSLRCFDTPAGIPQPSGKQWKSDRKKRNGGKGAAESLQASSYTRQSAHFSQKNRFSCQNDKCKNIRMYRVEEFHTLAMFFFVSACAKPSD